MRGAGRGGAYIGFRGGLSFVIDLGGWRGGKGRGEASGGGGGGGGGGWEGGGR